MKRIWNVTVSQGEIRADDPELFREYLSKLEGEAELTICRRKKHRTLNQNRYYWKVVIGISSDYFGYSPEETHDVLLAEYARHGRPFRAPGEKPEPIKRSSEMSTVEFEDYMSWIRRWMMMEYQVNIPEPNEVEV